MFIDGGDQLTSEVESLAVKPIPNLDEEGNVGQCFMSYTYFSYDFLSIWKISKLASDVDMNSIILGLLLISCF